MLSVVIPAYKQEKTIQKDIKNIENTLKTLEKGYEIILVCDGSLDKTIERAKEIKSKRLKVVGWRGANRGKGYALRYGTTQAKGEVVCFLDAGMEINPEGIKDLLNIMEEKDADIVVGSKLHPDSKLNYPLERRIFSWGYRFLTSLLFGLRVKDTQTGLKLFKKEVLNDVLPRLLVKQYAIDIEILAVARHLGYKKIYEGPVEVNYNFEDLTHASALRPIVRMFQDTLAVFYRLKILRYYDEKNKNAGQSDLNGDKL